MLIFNNVYDNLEMTEIFEIFDSDRLESTCSGSKMILLRLNNLWAISSGGYEHSAEQNDT